jgi:hypothetical protein
MTITQLSETGCILQSSDVQTEGGELAINFQVLEQQKSFS